MQQHIAKKVSRLAQHEKVRFAAVGVVNTAIDFGILFLLVDLFNVVPIVANIISTTVALAVSYTLNKKSVFGDNGSHNPTQIILFVTVTLAGLWGLQSLVIFVVSGWLKTLFVENIALFIAKIIASFFSLVWNYLWYSRIIFKRTSA